MLPSNLTLGQNKIYCSDATTSMHIKILYTLSKNGLKLDLQL